MKEVWKDIKGYEGLYQVSNLGRVKSVKCIVSIKKLTLNKKTGYLQVDLYKKNNRKKLYVHRLVLIAFKGFNDVLTIVNHKNSNKQDNVLSNLEWSDKSKNAIHYWNNSGAVGYWLGKTSYQNPNSKKVKGYCFKTNKLLYVFGSASEAVKLGFNQGLVSAVARGERSHHKNIIWKYV